jgi:hypothetical protein
MWTAADSFRRYESTYNMNSYLKQDKVCAVLQVVICMLDKNLILFGVDAISAPVNVVF